MAAALSTTPFVKSWLSNTQTATMLHLFPKVCNLINEAGEVVSLVLPEMGRGPFALVVAELRPFTETLTLDSPISINEKIQIGSLSIGWETAVLWNPTVDWIRLREQTAVWAPNIPELEKLVNGYRAQIGEETAVTQQRLEAGLTLLRNGISQQNQMDIQNGVEQLAGLGRGLTPAGDDLLLGVMYGLWATQPVAHCQPLIDLIVDTAVPRTTSLSAAWLKAAGRREAVAVWHEFGKRLSVDGARWQKSVGQILQTGHSSGADALRGFTAVVKMLI